jgi:hypothetical protein
MEIDTGIQAILSFGDGRDLGGMPLRCFTRHDIRGKGLQAILRFPEDMTDLTSVFSFNTPAVLEFQFHSS